MLLVLEIGNSTTVAGLFEADRLRRRWQAPTHPPAVEELLAPAPDDGGPVAIASVVPAATAAWRRRLGARARVVGDEIPRPLPVRYRPPESVGVDRLLDALAARERWGAPVLVADCGTATTLNAVAPDGAFVGGAILAGLALSRDALAQRTAQLPRVELAPPPRAIGDTTLDSLLSGLVYGHVGAIAGLAARMRDELAAPAAPLVATGGNAALLAAADPELFAAVDPDLTLHGLRLAHERATAGSCS